MADAELLHAWRNDSQTRAMSHSTGEVALAEHRTWLEKSLANESRRLYIFERYGRACGTVRVDLAGGVAELSWTVAPAFRRLGIGMKMVSLMAQEIDGPLRAEVKASNLASQKIARGAGMRLEHSQDGVLYFGRGPVAHKFT